MEDSFSKWALKVPSVEFDRWERYFQEFPGLRASMLQARQFIENMRKVQEAPPVDQELKESIWQHIQQMKNCL